ncbi:type IV toxin-antitoxin system AbiEi family antitoxin domain-containing protein [Pseudoflavitalea rhizosphaerae]|uniref:type IV toxin-antitoxin system AbiEi family antitoxin domain-containing protein n=1 Tax=Pseudoflavitalea rhizosphaerae TaxID=1884793 RepID=UPI000F8EFE39|nr:hypothetical protein [Pseudoflavitalea rhizosphaerae]
MNFNDSIQVYSEAPLTRQIIMDLLKEHKRPNQKIYELEKNGELIRLRNGLFVAGPQTKIQQPEPFLIANHLRGPSYVSLESALSYWGLIPERVFEVCSVTIKTSKTYRTAVGRFRYLKIPLPYFSFGIRSVSLTSKQFTLIGSPEKALCDKIVMTPGISLNSTMEAADFLIDDLRIDEDSLLKLNVNEIHTWISNAPNKRNLEILVKTLSTL